MTVIAIDDEWYDLTKWAAHHPGGTAILESMKHQDATDAFYSLHSEKAIAQLKKMRPIESKQPVPDAADIDVEYRQLKAKLTKEGWFERSLAGELQTLLPVLALFVLGNFFAFSHPVLAIVCLGVCMQQAGWLGHDMAHARNSSYNSTLLRYISGWINGFDSQWWSDKHNTHHVFTNHVNIDPDIHNQPFLFIWAPPKSLDHHLRKYQHYYFVPLYAFLYVSWRIASLQWAFSHKRYSTLAFTLLPGYVWLSLLPVTVTIPSILLAGFLVAMVVTVSHESEEILWEREPSFIKTQFRGTKDIVCPDFLTEFLFGGMQYQLEHHLFPTLPRYRYPELAKVVRAFSKEHGLDYKADGLMKTFKIHYETLKKNAVLPAVEEDVYNKFSYL